MHISKVELENFKSHTEAEFEFGRGTTSITGENGAGKTSIIEAIAWTIFDTLDYKKEDIVRRGARKGAVRVTFESGLDEREYTVYRDTGTGYYVYDPQLGMRIAEKKEEVKRFLWQHLGIEPGTDLDSLFTHAIGVPQGTFTAIFLATGAERKRTFDGLLKVEEYRRSSDELLKTVRFLDQQKAAVDIRIARAEGELARVDTVDRDLEEMGTRVVEMDRQLAELGSAAIELQRSVAKLDEVETQLNRLAAEVERLRGETAASELVLGHRRADLRRSQEAAEVVARVRDDAQAYQVTLGRIRELEEVRAERQNVRDELSAVEASLSTVKADRKHILQEMEKLQTARSQILSLTDLVADQVRLEREVAAKRLELTRSEASAGRLADIDKRLEDLRELYRDAASQLKAATDKGLGAAQLEKLQSRDAEIVRQLAAASATLERDERFKKEIQNGLCPILSARCLNLKEGETLEGFISSQFGELRMRIEVLQTEHRQVDIDLRAAREAERHGVRVSLLGSRLKEIEEDGRRLREQRSELEGDAARLAGVRQELQGLETELNALANPRAKISILETVVAREAGVREQLSAAEKNLERLERDRLVTIEKLGNYKDLDTMYAEADAIRERSAEAYRLFVANEKAAAQFAENQAAFDAAVREHDERTQAAAAASEAAKAAAGEYDRDLHLAERSALMDLQKRQVETSAMLDFAKKRLSELTAEAERLSEVRRSIQTDLRERERLQTVSETTDFIRSTLKDAAPLVARNYVHHVSHEANQMFREIFGSAETSLKWTDDYGIVLEQGGHERPFQSLSGGEQMAAAMSVRLALLKQLSDIHIAFFDEPTTNMDVERRENLASQIGNISHFDQLFVISHDDTFEGYMDHEVRVGDPR